MKLQEKLLECRKQKKVILATNFYNLETLQGILKAISELKVPVIFQLSESSINYIGLNMAVKMAKQGIADYGIEGWVHLDHGGSPELVKRCLDAGFDSVMIDASEKEFDENVRISAGVVEMAKSYGANVEAELGYIAKLGQNQAANGFTQPEDAKKFAELTGVNALAVAIGSAHGFYKKEPHLQIDLLEKIHQVTEVPLVLHGGSGIPSEMLREAVSHGICKINLATEIKDTFSRTVKTQMADTDEIDLRKLFPPAINSVKELIKAKILSIQSIK